MGADEEGTLARLQALRSELIDPAVAKSGGRIVKSAGDGILAEFPSAVEAVRCAVDMQTEMRRHEEARQPEQRIEFRIGINVGDVIATDDDIHGDGVNVAARLETLAEAGGILVSATVQATTAGRLACAFEDLGERALKNIAQPVRVYRVSPQASAERPALPLPDKPSIAVLPFANITGDPEQEYFADGVVEEITTALSRIRWLFVIARNSSFAYKGRAVDVRQVGRELGVRYVLEGSVRKAGNRVRITGQLVDATTGAHLWADRFDGALEDIFDLQDRVTSSVVGAIEPKILGAEIERAQRKPTESLQAYDLVLRAIPHLAARSRDGHGEATRLLQRAIEIDPNYARALVFLAWCHNLPWMQGWLEKRPPHDEIIRLTQAALQHGGDDPTVLHTAGFLTSHAGGDLDGGLALIERSLALNPNSARALATAGQMYAYAGDIDRALAYAERAAQEKFAQQP
jgi:adenylate cyclase